MIERAMSKVGYVILARGGSTLGDMAKDNVIWIQRLIYLDFSIVRAIAIDLSLDIRPIVIDSQSWTVRAFSIIIAQSLSGRLWPHSGTWKVPQGAGPTEGPEDGNNDTSTAYPHTVPSPRWILLLYNRDAKTKINGEEVI